MARAVAALREEIALRREHGAHYRYTGYVLRPDTAAQNGAAGPATWTVRAEAPGDAAAVRDIHLAAFPTAEEADLVDALRGDADAWIPGLSLVVQAPDGALVGHVLFTRCHVDGHPALALAPCAVLPAHQRRGAGTSAIRAGLAAARARGENLVLVLGHADYYPRFGFAPASRWGIRPPFEVPDEAMMGLALDPTRPVPSGVIAYPAAFGV
ncbi:GNAT family N-acetyltransferase [Thermobifida halotolerans]|nr:N-acetyltransferase [Thermobifida halotolerans]